MLDVSYSTHPKPSNLNISSNDTINILSYNQFHSIRASPQIYFAATSRGIHATRLSTAFVHRLPTACPPRLSTVCPPFVHRLSPFLCACVFAMTNRSRGIYAPRGTSIQTNARELARLRRQVAQLESSNAKLQSDDRHLLEKAHV